MAEALVSYVLEQLASNVASEVKLVGSVKKDLKNLKDTLETVRGVMEDAEQRQVKEKAVKKWLQNLKQVTYDMEDLLDEWSTTTLRSKIRARYTNKNKGIKFFRFSPSSYFKSLVQRYKIGHGIKEIRERLETIAKDRNDFHLNESSASGRPQREITSSVVELSDVYGRNHEKEVLMNKLLSEGSSSELKGTVPIICMVGMGGLGKTNLSQCLFNEPKVMNHFENRMWVCVSDPFHKEKVAKAIIEGATGEKALNTDLWDTLHRLLCDVLKDRLFLLVLDDVWTEKHAEWEPIKVAGAPRSRILVTTRSERVAKMMNATYTHPLGVLPVEDCWSIFSRIAFAGRGEEERLMLTNTGRKMVKRCKGVPLFVKTLAGAMRFQRREDWEDVSKTQTWEIPEVAQGVLPTLLFSYYSLPPNLKRCFEFCAFFPKDDKLEKDKLIQLWMAHGFLESNRGGRKENMEKRGEDYFDNLVIRSLLQDVEEKEIEKSGLITTKCKMHDLVHDLAQFLTSNESVVMETSTSEITGKFEKVSGTFHHQMIQVEEEDVPAEGVSDFLYNEIKKKKHLRTLKLDWSFSFISFAVFARLFCHLTCLRALDLSETDDLESLPNEVENLIHLRYLDLSGTKLKKLPKTLSKLCNLQTLRLNWCPDLEELPQGVGNMISLRHIENMFTYSLRCMPEGMGQLTNLRTLLHFTASSDGSGSESGSCKLGELKDVNLLQGTFWISGLETVTDFDEAKEANLMQKEHLSTVFLVFTSLHSMEENIGEGDVISEDEIERLNGVLEGLQLHPNVKRLEISQYRGSKFPSWMMYSLLQHLSIEDCLMLKALPALGKLKSLKELTIGGLKSVKCIGGEFLGLEYHNNISDSGGASICSSNREEPITAFPNLISLRFDEMEEWEEWELPTAAALLPGEDVVVVEDYHHHHLQVMPCLSELSLRHCPKLRALPALGRLQSLMDLQVSLKSIKYIGKEFWGISDIADHQCRSSSTWGSSSSSRSSGRGSDGDMVQPASVIVFPKLKVLSFLFMEEWEEWEVLPQPTTREESKEGIGGGGESSGEIMINENTTTNTNIRIIMPCLKLLSIAYCPKLKSIPLNISSHTPWKLEIKGCPVLTQSPIPTEGMQQLQELRVDGHLTTLF